MGYQASAENAALALESAPDGSGAVMIRSFKHQHRYLYLPRGSWTVGTYDNDPGTGGYWVFDPPLPQTFQLRPFSGRRCSFDCSGSLRMAFGFLVHAVAFQVLW